MKSVFLLLVSTFVSTQSMAITKMCYGLGDAKGSNFKVEFNAKEASLSQGTGEMANWDTEHAPRLKDVKSRKGQIYLVYELDFVDGSNHLLLEQGLTQPGNVGYAKMRNRGEGYFQSDYQCQDVNLPAPQ